MSKLGKKGSKLYILCRRWLKDQNQLLMELLSEEFVSEITFSKYCSFDSGGDIINPKLGQKRPKLVFHVPMVIERWKSIVKENLKWSIHFWNNYLKVFKFWLHMVMSPTQKTGRKGPNWYFMYQYIIFKVLGLIFSSNMNWDSYIISIPKTVSKKIGALICSMKFLSPEFALYLYKFTICPSYMEYCCHIWAGIPSCYFELLDKLQKWILRTVVPALAAALDLLAHRQNVASLSLFYRYYFGRCS